jgi:hypothetical protein
MELAAMTNEAEKELVLILESIIRTLFSRPRESFSPDARRKLDELRVLLAQSSPKNTQLLN